MKNIFSKMIRPKDERELLKNDVVCRSINKIYYTISYLTMSLGWLVISYFEDSTAPIILAILFAYIGVVYGFYTIQKILLEIYKKCSIENSEVIQRLKI